MKAWAIILLFVASHTYAQHTQDSLTKCYPFLALVFDSTTQASKGSVDYTFYSLSIDSMRSEPKRFEFQLHLRVQFAASYPEGESIIIMEDLDSNRVVAVSYASKLWWVKSGQVNSKSAWPFFQRLPFCSRKDYSEGMFSFNYVFHRKKSKKYFVFDTTQRLLVSNITDFRRGYRITDTTENGTYYTYESPRNYQHKFDKHGELEWASRQIINERQSHYDSLSIESRTKGGESFFQLKAKYSEVIRKIEAEIEWSKRSPFYETWYPQIGDTIQPESLQTLVNTDNDFLETNRGKLVVFHTGENSHHLQLMAKAKELELNTELDLIYVANRSSNVEVSKELAGYPNWSSCQVYQQNRLVHAQIPIILLVGKDFAVQKVYWDLEAIDWNEMKQLAK